MLITNLVCLLSLLFLVAVQAHLKVYFAPYRLPIRNAPGPNSDGLFSAAANQPCGGRDDWGRNNQRRYARSVVDGQRVCARVNWNGGHSYTTYENKLRAVFACNRPTDRRYFLNLPYLELANGTNPPPDEPRGTFVSAPLTNALYDGYVICVDLPIQNISYTWNSDDQRRQCSLSIMEGNGWGGCMDMLLLSKYDANGTERVPYNPLVNATTGEPLFPTTSTSTSDSTVGVIASRDINIMRNSEGTYRIENCLTDTGGSCCLTGFFAVLNNGAVSARFYGSSPQSVCFDLNYYGYRDYQMILRPSRFDPTLFETNFYLDMGYDTYGRPVTRQNMSLTMRDGGNMQITNVGLDIPEVSDHDVVYFSSLEDGLVLGYIPVPNYSTQPDVIPWGIIVGATLGGLLVIYLVAGWIYNWREGGPCCQHPHIHACLVGCGCVKNRRRAAYLENDGHGKYALQLPPNWYSAVDQTSGEVYYFNTVTKETKWERPNLQA